MIDLTSYYNAGKAFDRSLQQMKEDYDYLKKSGKVSKAFLSKQKQLIKNLEFNQNVFEEEIFRLDNEYKRLDKRLKNQKLKAEAIFITHGIMDFPKKMNMRVEALVEIAKMTYKNEYIELPIGIKRAFGRIPEEDRKILERILFKQVEKKIEKDIQEFNYKCQKRKQQIQSSKEKKNTTSSKSKITSTSDMKSEETL